MTKCLRPHHDLDDFTTYDFTTLRLVIDLETIFCTVNPVSRSIKNHEVVKVVMWSQALRQLIVSGFGLVRQISD
jgi:hypothetical protein